jgi:hypothetical protein
VGKMGFLVFGVTYIVLGIIAVMKTRVGHA